jgi:hypothetical protein
MRGGVRRTRESEVSRKSLTFVHRKTEVYVYSYGFQGSSVPAQSHARCHVGIHVTIICYCLLATRGLYLSISNICCPIGGSVLGLAASAKLDRP